MSNHVSDEERLRRINLVYECIKEGMSTRECAAYLEAIYGITISNVTVKDYIDRMMSINIDKYHEMQEVIKDHTPQTVNLENVRTRVKNVLISLAAGYTFDEIAAALDETVFTVYRDYAVRKDLLTDSEKEELGITKEMLENIETSLKEKKLDNLKRR